MRTCPFCRQEFDTSGEYAKFLVLKVGGSEKIICGDCKKSFFRWIRSREEDGLERKEKANPPW